MTPERLSLVLRAPHYVLMQIDKASGVYRRATTSDRLMAITTTHCRPGKATFEYASGARSLATPISLATGLFVAAGAGASQQEALPDHQSAIDSSLLKVAEADAVDVGKAVRPPTGLRRMESTGPSRGAR